MRHVPAYMRCAICHHVPSQFCLFGGGYWRTLWGDQLCPTCLFWAVYMIGVPEERA